MSYRRVSLAAGVALALAAGSAQAAPLAGAFSMVGFDFSITQAANHVVAIDFAPGNPGSDTGLFMAGSAVGDFAGLDGAVGTVHGFDTATPDELIWQLSGLGNTFVFTGLSIATNQILSGVGDAVLLRINGIVTATGYDPTAGTWIFTGNRNALTASWSASVGVPEPATATTLGLGLLALCGLRRRKG